jgi:hypothetical protein
MYRKRKRTNTDASVNTEKINEEIKKQLKAEMQNNLLMERVLTPKFGKVRSLICGSNSVRNPSGRRKVSSERFGKRVCGRQFASVRQGNYYADFAALHGDVARAEGTNGWIGDRI